MAAHHSVVNKRLVAGIGFLLLIATLLLTLSVYTKKDSNVATEERIAPTDIRGLNAQRVFIKDLHTFSNFINSSEQENIERRLYLHTATDKDYIHDDHRDHDSESSHNSSDPGGVVAPDLYTGTIRPGSFLDTVSDGVRSVELLVDIEPANLTYKILIVEQSIAGHKSKSTYISCAPDELKIDSSVKCTQGAA